MKFTHLSLLLFLSLLATTALASSRIALVRLTRGLATVDGKPLQSPLLVSENAVLVVSDNSRVRIQLLGSNRELTVEGSTQLVLRSAELKRQASAIKRLPVAVAANADGTSHVGSAAVTVAPASPLPAPPRAGAATSSPSTSAHSAARWTRPLVLASPQEIDSQTIGFVAPSVQPLPTQLNWSITDPQDNNKVVARGVVDELEFEKSLRTSTPVIIVQRSLLQESRRYKLELSSDSGTEVPHATAEPFRLLSSEEKTALAESVTEARDLTDRSEKMAVLVDSALLHYAWDQWPRAQALLQESQTLANWSLLDEDTLIQTRIVWNTLRGVLGNPIETTPGDPQ